MQERLKMLLAMTGDKNARNRARDARRRVDAISKRVTYHSSKDPAAVQLVEQFACGFGHNCGRASQTMLGNILFK